MTKTIDYFFGIGSPWSYIGLDPFTALAGRFGAEIRPYVIPLIKENGAIYSKDRPEARRAYWTTDLKRWAAVQGKALNFENQATLSDPTPAGLMVIAAHKDGKDWLQLTRSLQKAFWGREEDIGRTEVRNAIIDGVGLDGSALEARIEDPDIQNAWITNRELAKAAGVFGLPTYRYENELYWGQDSLQFLERHLNSEKLIL